MKVAVNHVAASAIDGGDLVVARDLVGIAVNDMDVGETGQLYVHGIFNVVKATGVGTAIALGSKVYYDATNKVTGTDDGAGANKLVGKTVRAAEDGDRFVRVLLTP